MSEAEPNLEPVLPERYPFWSYGDLALFIGLSLPSLILGALLVRVFVWAFHIDVGITAAELLSAQFTGYGFLFLALYLILRLHYNRPFWRSLGWVQAPIRPLTLVLLGFVLAFLVAAAGTLLRTPDLNSPLKQLLSDPASAALVAAFAITLGPLCEELAFRGFMQPLLVRSLGPVLGIVVTALPFGLLHLQQNAFSWRHGLLITLAGVAFGWIRHLSGSTKAATIMHAAYNSTFFILFLMQKKIAPPPW